MRRGRRIVSGTRVKPLAVCASMLRASVDGCLVRMVGRDSDGSRVPEEAKLVLLLLCRNPQMMHLRSYAHGFGQG